MFAEPRERVTDDVRPEGNALSAARLVRGLRETTVLARRGTAGKELRERLIGQAQRLFGADAVALWRLESRERIWRIAAAVGLSESYAAVAIPVPPDYETESVLPGPILIPDVRAWPPVDERGKLYESEGVASFLVLPLNIRGETAGTISCYYRAPRTQISDLEVDAAAVFAEMASTPCRPRGSTSSRTSPAMSPVASISTRSCSGSPMRPRS